MRYLYECNAIDVDWIISVVVKGCIPHSFKVIPCENHRTIEVWSAKDITLSGDTHLVRLELLSQ